jgi:hypothetical protein
MSWAYYTPNLPPAEASHGQRNRPCKQAKSKGIVFSRFQWAEKHPGGTCLLTSQSIGRRRMMRDMLVMSLLPLSITECHMMPTCC